MSTTASSAGVPVADSSRAGRPLTTSTSVPSRFAVCWPAASRSRPSPGTRRAVDRARGVNRVRSCVTAPVATGGVPGMPTTTASRCSSTGMDAPTLGAGSGSGTALRISTPAGTDSTTWPSIAPERRCAAASSQLGTGWRRPRGRGAMPGANRHQPPVPPEPDGTNSEPPGEITTGPAGATTSNCQSSRIRRAGAGRPG